jgi:xanthine dehydrogenase accessory factor
VTWIDSRAELLPAGLPDNIRALHAHEPVETVSAAPVNARYLVMTHDHAVDYALCRAILSRGEFAWLGLIGSRSKGAKFRSRLARDGVAPEMIARMVCPIGVGGVESKSPAAIAIAVAAQLLQTVDAVGGAAVGADVRADAVGRVAVDAVPGAATAGRAALLDACSTPDCTHCTSHNTDRQP